MKFSFGLRLTVLLVCSSAVQAQTGNPGGAINDRLGNYDYGVCRGVDPKCYHDWAKTKATEYRVLLYTHTAGPRHADLGTPLSPGLNPPLADNNAVPFCYFGRFEFKAN